MEMSIVLSNFRYIISITYEHDHHVYINKDITIAHLFRVQ